MFALERTLMRLAMAGEQPQAGNNSSPSSLASALTSSLENPESPAMDNRISALLNAERLKMIDELSRVILELRRQFPELAQSLEKARDGFSANPEELPAKRLTAILNSIQQYINKPELLNKPEIQEAIKNLASDAVKVLQPKTEMPAENKLILALSQNDFAKASAIIKNIVENQMPKLPLPAKLSQPVQQAMAPQAAQAQASSAKLPQALPQAAQPAQAQQAPQSSQAQQQAAQTPPGIKLTQPVQQAAAPQVAQPSQAKLSQALPLPQAAQPAQVPHSPQSSQVQPQAAQTPPEVKLTQPVQQAVAPQVAQPSQAKLSQALPLPQAAQSTQPAQAPHSPQSSQAQPQAPQQTYQQAPQATQAQQPAQLPPIKLPQLLPAMQTSQLPQLLQAPQTMQPRQIPPSQAPQIILNVLQELKSLGLPSELRNAPLKELEHIILQKTGVEVEANAAKKLQSVFNEKPMFAAVVDIPLPKKDLNNVLQSIAIASQGAQNTQNAQKPEAAFSLYEMPAPSQQQRQQSEAKFILQAWPASAQIPKEEQSFWIKTGLPLTPQTISVREALLSFGKLPESPELVKAFAENLHEMSLRAENGAAISKEQVSVLWRVMQAPAQNPQQIPPQITQTLLNYQPLGNYEGELFKNLPEPARRELLHELPAGKTWQPEVLQKAIEKILEKLPPQLSEEGERAATAKEETRHVLQNLKEQIQWTRIDQDTRPAQDRENVFYFMHNNELQKGRLKVKDERKGGGKRNHDSSISFSIETKVKNLGNVHADLTLSKSVLNIRLKDEMGIAGEAVKEERETLAKELADIGISLGELLYGKTPKIHSLPIAKAKEKSSGLDVKA